MKLTIGHIRKLYKQVEGLKDEPLVIVIPPRLHKKMLEYSNIKVIKNKKVKTGIKHETNNPKTNP
jgi:hypothetical protein